MIEIVPGGADTMPVPAWTLDLAAPTIGVRSKKTRQTRQVPAWLTMNARLHWRATAKRKELWRELVGVRAAGYVPAGLVQVARFDVRLRFRTSGRRDTTNWHPTAKLILDELVSRDFLPDDSPAFLHCEDCPHLRIGERLDRDDPAAGRLIITATALELRQDVLVTVEALP